MPEFMARLKTPRLPSAPTSPVVGEMYFNTANNELYHWNGTAWMTNSELTYIGNYNAGTTYYDGDIVVGADGITYMCVQDGTVGSTPVPWTAVTTGGGGYEYGYDQITAPVNVTATSEASPQTVIPGSPHTFDGNPVMFEFQAPYVQTDAVANTYTFTGLFEGSTEIAKFSIVTAPAGAAIYAPVRGSVRFTPSAGVHTYSVKAWSTGGTGAVGAGAGGTNNYGPAYLRSTSVTWYSGSGVGMPSPVINGQWIKGAAGAATWAQVVSTRQINATASNIVITPPVGLMDSVWLNPSGGSIQNIDPTGLANGTTVTLWNWAGTPTTIQHMGGTGRLWITAQANIVLKTYETATFVWDAGLNLWIQVAQFIAPGDYAPKAPSFVNGYSHYGAPFGPARYRKLAGGLVVLDGLIIVGTPASTAYTLPVGYRPAEQLIFITASSQTTTPGETWRIDQAGGVNYTGGVGAGGWVSTSGIQFYADF